MDRKNVESRSFLGALALAIKAIAMLVIDAVNVLSNSVAMAGTMVEEAREKQLEDIVFERDRRKSLSVARAAAENMKTKRQIEAIVGNDPAAKAEFNETVNRLKAAVEKELALLKERSN